MQKYISILIISLLLFSCSSSDSIQDTKAVEKKPHVRNMEVPEWSKNANIYEVNIRQYTPEGTLVAFQKHLPRLKKMGVDILWLMPIHPIGKLQRKGDLGSPYSTLDYKKLNPDFGSEQDLKNLITEAHNQGFKVILDWVANHSAFDNHWAIEHPEWYTQDSTGNIIHPKDTDWTDVADFNYDNKDMRAAMIDAMEYWVKDFDIDGYRCDVAGFVPNDFWSEAITSLQDIKHVFMLAEWDEGKMHDAGFHMTYGWGFHHVLNGVAKGEKEISEIDKFMTEDATKYKTKDFRMNFTSNHDENSWNGTVYERMGNNADAMTVIAFTLQGMPLVYGGQEATLNKRLSFFGKDTIDWTDTSKSLFFNKLLELKHNNKAIWNGDFGGKYNLIPTSNDKNIFMYERVKGDKKVIVALNLSKEKQSFNCLDCDEKVALTNLFTPEQMTINKETSISLESGKYVVLSK